MNRWHTMSFRTDDVTFKRIQALAEQEDRTISKVLDMMVREKLNDLECSAIIRQADSAEIDMRFCSPHCRHKSDEFCHCSIVIDSIPQSAPGAALFLKNDGEKYLRHGHCPYTLREFQWWQRCADEDARAMEEG